MTLRRSLAALILAAGLVSASGRADAQTQPASIDSPAVFDVRNGDQQGKLMFKETELAFESLTDARQSRNWKYAEIREVSKRKKNLRVRPFKGSTYDFQFKKSQERDKIYDMIASRVLAARQGAKK
ncbi:MAG: hypothetical protein JNL98_04350 [Bryobacterales bacterium]|nr:hypothetical protein [Bryobacterales bacterium]